MTATERTQLEIYAGAADAPDGGVFKSVRKGMVLTQKEFAKMLGITNIWLCWVETGRYKASRKLAKKLLAILEKSD